jgi:hypothetical protein
MEMQSWMDSQLRMPVGLSDGLLRLVNRPVGAVHGSSESTVMDCVASAAISFQQNVALGSSPTFDEASYREVTTATHLEMLQRPGLVAYRLVDRLVEGLGTWARFQRNLAEGASDS